MDQEFRQLFTSEDDDAGRRVALGADERGVYRCEDRQPLIVFGPQRSGKTTGVVIPAVLEWSGPCLVTSVRFDVIAATLEHRSSLGEVFIFDPAGLTESIGRRFAPHCVGWSPLDSIRDWDDAVRQAESLTSGTDFRTMRSGDFWASHARLLLTPLLYAAARTEATMGDVLEWLNQGQPADTVTLLIERRQRYDRDPQAGGWERCITRLLGYDQYHSDTYTNICATAAGTLEVFALEGVNRRCAQTRRLPLQTFLDGRPHTLFLCAPPHQQKQFMPLFTALARQTVSATIDRNGVPEEDGQAIIQVPLMLCLDEAGNIARLDDLDTFATTAAGSGIQLISVFHDMSQLRATYGEDRGALIVNNHRGKLFLPGNSDPRTGDFLHELLQQSDVRGHGHRGWRRSDLREMPAETVLCLYGGLPAKLMRLRRWNSSPRLRDAVEEARRAYRRNPPRPVPAQQSSTPPDPVPAASLDELEGLRDFVLKAVDTHHVGTQILPCWFAHRPAVDILLKLIDEADGQPIGYEEFSQAARQVQQVLLPCRGAHVTEAPPVVRRSASASHRQLLDQGIRTLRLRNGDGARSG
ncbi:type IV secretory system conjugative DNA transfer family protein [Streptomyces torulosus]|uniref:type IV secretory system conjugative DNA transfer family protein n=1 Tax=Streptomyces torulosus TaxID=68276 RepID=UPI0006EB74F6|nr:type IV secretory system conjugative DNA transfer family protein [Streptomyces torulosus]